MVDAIITTGGEPASPARDFVTPGEGDRSRCSKSGWNGFFHSRFQPCLSHAQIGTLDDPEPAPPRGVAGATFSFSSACPGVRPGRLPRDGWDGISCRPNSITAPAARPAIFVRQIIAAVWNEHLRRPKAKGGPSAPDPPFVPFPAGSAAFAVAPEGRPAKNHHSSRSQVLGRSGSGGEAAVAGSVAHQK